MIARFIAALALLLTAAAAPAQSRAEIERTMRRATTYMVEQVATNGGYVWAYLPDRSRRWGEIEARPSMIWVQPPGTATMGHLFLDAYHATGDEYYYQAAERAAGALIAGQHRSGGWHYFIDFAGPESTRQWYRTIGRNAWRMEEFQHSADNATFDDAGTSEAMQLLLRMYLEKNDEKYRPPLDRAIGFVLASQYPNGGWPQRWPHARGYPAYADYITFNDDVAQENIRFLLMVYQSLGEERVRPAILRAGEVFLATQQPMPQPGWSLQHRLDLKPAGARSYEPLVARHSHHRREPADDDEFYRLTADPRYPGPGSGGDRLARIAAPAGRSGAARPRLPDLHRAWHEPAALRPPARLQRRQRPLLLGLQPGRDARPLRRLPGDRHRGAAPRLSPAAGNAARGGAAGLAAACARPCAAAALSPSASTSAPISTPSPPPMPPRRSGR